jgi:osmotically-inducible protein OsmY
MLKRVLRTGLLLPVMVLPVHADWEFPVFSARSPDPAGMDRAFECEVHQLLDEHADRLQGVNAVVTRFGNTIVITGQAQDAGDRMRVDQLVLDAAGIMREQEGSPAVVPASTRGCEGKALASNTKRKSIVKTGKDCSSLRVDRDMQIPARGRVFNHIAVASPDPVKQRASAALLAAQASMSLIDADVINAMDRRLIRLVAQDGVIYVLGNLDAARQTEIRTVLMKLDGVNNVRFYAD